MQDVGTRAARTKHDVAAVGRHGSRSSPRRWRRARRRRLGLTLGRHERALLRKGWDANGLRVEVSVVPLHARSLEGQFQECLLCTIAARGAVSDTAVSDTGKGVRPTAGG
jgi:hypothetical protein